MDDDVIDTMIDSLFLVDTPTDFDCPTLAHGIVCDRAETVAAQQLHHLARRADVPEETSRGIKEYLTFAKADEEKVLSKADKYYKTIFAALPAFRAIRRARFRLAEALEEAHAQRRKQYPIRSAAVDKYAQQPNNSSGKTILAAFKNDLL